MLAGCLVGCLKSKALKRELAKKDRRYRQSTERQTKKRLLQRVGWQDGRNEK